MILNAPQKLCLGFFAITVALWVALFVAGTVSGPYNYLYSFLFGLIPFFSGITAMICSQTWGGLKSAVGKAIFFIGLGIFCWGAGENIWSYYNFVLNVPAPYPSLADIGFAPSIFFYGLGAIYLSRAAGAQFALRNKNARAFAILAPFVIFGLSYYILVTVARGGVLVPDSETALKTVLDLAYPLGDFVGLTVAVIVSSLTFKYLGGRYIWDIYAILAGLFVMFVGDTIFSYTTTVGTYYNGDFGDLVLATGMFLLSFGILGFYALKGADR